MTTSTEPIKTDLVEIPTSKCGKLKVYTHGPRSSNETAILTVHDIGCNHSHFLEFLHHPEMEHITRKFFWIHVDVPGQGNNEPDLPYDFKFPSIQEIADDIIYVVKYFKLKHVVLLGEGAGANIVARFAMAFDDFVLGCMLVHIVGQADSFISRTRKRSMSSKIGSQGMHAAAEEYLIKHRFGSVSESGNGQVLGVIEAYKYSLNTLINAKNLECYMTAYIKRNGIKEKIGDIKCPTLFVTGAHAAYNRDVADLHYSMQRAFDNDPAKRSKIELVQVGGVANPIVQKPGKVAEFIQYFLQGLGLGGGILARRMSTSGDRPPLLSKTPRSMSMEEYENPRTKDFFKDIWGDGGRPKS